MEEKYELYKHVYQDAEMACYTLTKLMDDLKEKDNKIKGILKDILKKYQEWKEKAKKELKENDCTLDEKGIMSKIMANMGIKKEVKKDNSDSSIAEMIIQGISMGSLDAEKKISSYDNEVEKKQIKFVKDFLKFQEESINNLKSYL